jgi:hypothetical protein
MIRPAPLASWFIAVVGISPLLYTSVQLAVSALRGTDMSADAVVSQRIAAYFAEPGSAGARRGVMFGISGGRCVFAGAPAGGVVQVLSVAALGQGFHELYPYIDQVIASKPDFILIQGTALATAVAQPSPYEVARRLLRQRLFWPIAGGDDAHLEGAIAGVEPDACVKHALALEGWVDDLAGDVAWVTHDPGEEARVRLLRALESMLDSGIPLFVFDQPRNDYSVEYHRHVDRQVDALLARLGERRRRVRVLRYPESLPTSLFFDPVHVTPEGGALFRTRLLGDVVATLDARTAAR